jgi:CDP-diglyceride synthetase
MDSLSELCAVLCVFPLVTAWCYGSFNPWTLLTLLLPVGILIAELWNKDENPIQQWGHFLIGQMMIAFPFALMNVLCDIDRYLLLAVFVLIWVNDSGAYCVGVLTAKKMPGGNHKMFPRVSPKKSWEGLAGGLFGSCLTWSVSVLIPGLQISIGQALLFGLVCGVMSVLGDLAESRIKRNAGFKDSGTIMPGHGGLFDRCDSLMPTAVASALLLFGAGCLPLPF